MQIAILIPARIDSSRFPRKMLADMGNGKTLIRHVYDECCKSPYDVYVVTDSQEIFDEVGSNAILTGVHENGTSRCAEAAEKLGYYDAYINVQGDMPDITVEMIEAVARGLIEYTVSTLHTSHPTSVKIVHSGGIVQWCSRYLPYGSNHIGVYGYSRFALEAYRSLTQYPEEKIESLEQLRWIQNGVDMTSTEVDFSGIEINTFQDLDAWRKKHAT